MLSGFLFLPIVFLPAMSFAETLVATRTIRSHTILTQSDVAMLPSDSPGVLTNVSSVIGLESKIILYEGREIGPNDVGPAAIIERNQLVSLVFTKGSLQISTDARSLGRAAIGELVSVLNLSSKKTVTGIVNRFGTVVVGNVLTSRN